MRSFGKRIGFGVRADSDTFNSAPQSRGGFNGGKIDRLTGDWQPGNSGPNLLHQLDGKLLRERARDLYINNPFARSAVNAYIANVIECGILPKQPEMEDESRRMWLRAWEEWASTGADVTRQQHLYELMSLWLREIIVSGGCLVYYPQLSRQQSRDQIVPLAVQLIPEERFAEDFDSVMPGYQRREGVSIQRGVEVDNVTGRHLAYWVTPGHPNDLNLGWQKPIRLDAADCCYGYFRERIGQNRGFTLLASAIIWLWKLGYYLDNELMNSAIRSCWAAMVITDAASDDWDDLSDVSSSSEGGGVSDIYGNRFERIQPAMIWRGQKGDDIKGVGPNTPPGDSATWLRMIQRSIAAGMDLSYSEVMHDTGESSFSAVRAEANADRKRFKSMQRFAINHFCAPAARRFNEAAVLRGLDGFPSASEYASDPYSYRASWQPPGWTSVNPKEDAMADSLDLANCTVSREEIIGRRGGDRDTVFGALAIENADEVVSKQDERTAPKQESEIKNTDSTNHA